MKSKLLLGCVLVAGLAAACGGDDGEDASSDPTCTDTYANYAQAFFAQQCNTCHSAAAFKQVGGGEIQLDSLALVRDHKSHVIEHAVDLKVPVMPQTMPNGLPEADRLRLKKWYDCGAKE